MEFVQFNTQYGEVLRQFRLQRQLSQLDLEIEANLTFGTVCRIEKGRINPTKETLIKIAYVLNLSEKEFLNLLGFVVAENKMRT